MTPDEQKVKELIEKEIAGVSHTFVDDETLENGDKAEIKTTIGLDDNDKPTASIELNIKF